MDMRYVVRNFILKLKDPFSRQQRRKRMDLFIQKMGLRGGERILDMGGVASFWQDCPLPLEITIINLPGSGLYDNPNPIHTVTYVEGDACNMPFIANMSYDIAFSNSVIEHVGPACNQLAFAREVQRVAPRYWVQTPSIWFPIEAHTYMPFWWAYPEPIKQGLIARWKRKLPAWTEMIEGTTVIKRSAFQQMFPKAAIWTEYFSGFPKSYVVYR